jgi:hypothetical protein
VSHSGPTNLPDFTSRFALAGHSIIFWSLRSTLMDIFAETLVGYFRWFGYLVMLVCPPLRLK